MRHLSAPTLPSDLHAVLEALVQGQRAILGDALVGVYLQGSFATGDGDPSSDVDWVAAVARPLSEAQVAALQSLAVRLFTLPSDWAQHLEGSYIPVSSLRRLGDVPEQHWYLDNGSVEMVRSDHDSTRVVRWMLHAHGIALYGPPATQLVDPVPADDLRAEVRLVFTDWAATFLDDPARVSTRWYQAFVVLSYCRMLQTLQEGGVYSKPEGVRWALAHLDRAWHDLIDAAWQERVTGAWARVFQAADPAVAKRTLDFVRYAIALSERLPAADVTAEARRCL